MIETNTKNITFFNNRGRIVIKGDYDNPTEGDLIYIVEDGKTIIKEWVADVGQWISTSFSVGPASIALGFQVSVGDTWSFPSYRINKEPGSRFIPALYEFSESGEVRTMFTYKLTGLPNQTDDQNDGTVNHPAILTDGLYTVSSNIANVENFLVWKEKFRAGDTNPTEPVRFRTFEDVDADDPLKQTDEHWLPVSLWDGKSPGDYIEFNIEALGGVAIPGATEPGQTYHVVYDSIAPFSLYGDVTQIFDSVTGQTFKVIKILTDHQNRCCVKKSADQTITTATWTAISFDEENYDTSSMHDNVTNNTRITVQEAGEYRINYHVKHAANDKTSYESRIWKNGAAEIEGTCDIGFGSKDSSFGTLNNHSHLITFAVDDYIELQIIHDQGTDQDVSSSNTFFELYQVYE